MCDGGVGDILAEAFRTEVPCDAAAAAGLAVLARQCLPALAGGPEDTDEDRVVRLRDPRIFGAFVEAVVRDRRLSARVRRGLVEHAFDLLPLPRTEGEVIHVASRAPPHLLALASLLAADGELTVLHVMHLVFAVFLDRGLVTSVPRRTRSAVLHAILKGSEGEDALRVLYASLHLGAVPEAEAIAEARRILRCERIARSLRRSLASLAASPDGGRVEFMRMAQKEGLLPSDVGDPQSPEMVANIPRLPAALGNLGRRRLRALRDAGST